MSKQSSSLAAKPEEQQAAEWRARKGQEASHDAEEAQKERGKRQETAKENAYEREFIAAHDSPDSSHSEDKERDRENGPSQTRDQENGFVPAQEVQHQESGFAPAAEQTQSHNREVEHDSAADFKAWLGSGEPYTPKQEDPSVDHSQELSRNQDIDVA